ncbi:DUF4278 domain-containing protein [Leptolyngbya ohadii]|uniref:DUF4278 domain-containing protein n=1 Tax=Leptolyngbya ohadii TaxID=1962290 RepID=UPI000B59ED3C|nr:DUF4278 domain-containing protein [Leptolyngbya ohadii]
MNVSYRGIAYETEIPVAEGTETDRTALFLGNRFKVKQYNVSQRHTSSVQLKYRGANYNP